MTFTRGNRRLGSLIQHPGYQGGGNALNPETDPGQQREGGEAGREGRFHA